MFFYSVTPTADTTMTDYVRDSSGQWLADEGVDDPAAVHVQLRTPAGDYRIKVVITIDGIAFRTHQEKGIASALELARAPAPAVNEPVNEPIINEPANSEATSPSEAKRVSATNYRRSDVSKQLAGFLRSQSANTSSAADFSELQWMVTQWLPGSRVLVAEERFGLQHRKTAPLLRTISPESATISIAELDRVPKILIDADTNSDQTVSLSEISGTSEPWWNENTLLTSTGNPEVVDLTIALNLSGESSTCSVASASLISPTKATGGRLIHDAPFGQLIVVPVRDDRTADSFFESGQISISVVVMPNPLFTFADKRSDGRLDLREIRELPDRIRSLDRNKDGHVTTDELPAQVMLVVSQGPWANRLATQISATPVVAPVPPQSVPIPSWFSGMDANQDGLVARAEFFGNDEQFDQYDTDADGMISTEEVAK
ncbi:hypothetical protein [Rubripirellula tenax]|nr:hypothetical protein [Rubripirellula tenax]